MSEGLRVRKANRDRERMGKEREPKVVSIPHPKKIYRVLGIFKPLFPSDVRSTAEMDVSEVRIELNGGLAWVVWIIFKL